MIQETSINSFHIIKSDLGNRQKEVYESILLLFEPNNLDISIWLNKPINSITPRVNELLKKDLIIIAGKKYDQRTNRMTNYYEIS